MPEFSSIDHIMNAARGILSTAETPATAKRHIRALPGPMLGAHPEGAPMPKLGMTFAVVGNIDVRFHEDGTRTATFTIARGHDDPDSKTIDVVCAPEAEDDSSDLMPS